MRTRTRLRRLLGAAFFTPNLANLRPVANGSPHLVERHGIPVRAIEQPVEFGDVGRRAPEDDLSGSDQKLDAVARTRLVTVEVSICLRDR